MGRLGGTVLIPMLSCAVFALVCAAAGSPENPGIRPALKGGASGGASGAMADVGAEEEKAGKMDVEVLLAKIRQAQMPTKNMVMEWETDIFVPIPARRKYKAFITGKRGRLEYVQESYKRRIGGESYHIVQRTQVFDGTQQRVLERTIKQKHPIQSLTGRIRKSSYFDFMRFFGGEAFGWGYLLDPTRLRKTFNRIELHEGNTAGIYLLDFITPSGERARLAVDGNRGYHIVKKESFDHDKAGNKKSSELNVSLEKRTDGLWYPASRESTVFPDRDDRALVLERNIVKRVEFSAEIPDETFNLEFVPGTAVWDNKLEEHVAISAPNTIDLLTLLAKVQEAVKPAETMRVHWTTSHMGISSKLLFRTRVPVWQVRDFTALISDNRSRIDWTQRMYRKKTDETPLYAKKMSSVFDGHERRELTEEVENDRTDYSGTISERYNNDSWLLPFIHATPSKMGNFADFKRAAKGIEMKVTGSPRPGVYTLDAFVYWHDVLEETGGQRWQLTIDGNRGFNPIRSVLYGDNDAILEERHVTLREYAEGIWYPAAAERIKYSGDEIERRTQVEIEAEFDVEVPADAFKLEFGPGTKVRDLSTGKEVVIGDAGEPNGKANEEPPARSGTGERD